MKTNKIIGLTLTAAAMGIFVSMGVVSQDLKELRTGIRPKGIAHKEIAKAPEHSSYTANLIGFVYYAESWDSMSEDLYTPMGIYTIDVTPGSQPEPFAQIGKASSHCNGGAVLAGNTYWYIWRQTDPSGQGAYDITQLYSYNIETGAAQSHGVVSSDLVSTSDKTWDPTTGKIYGQYKVGDKYKLSIIDYEEQTVTPVADVTLSYGLACDNTGQLYGIDGSGNLNKIDKNTGATTRIGNTGVTPVYSQSMTYDAKTGYLWWASYTQSASSPSVLYKVDPQTAEATAVTVFSDKQEIMGLGVMPAIAPDKAPGYATYLKLDTDKASTDAVLSFTLPAYTFLGEELNGTVNWVAKSNGNKLADGIGNPGEEVSVEVTLPTGTNNITVVCSNAEGNGPAAEISRWIGQGYPLSPKNVEFTLDESNGSVNLSWSPVTEAEKDGYLDPEAVRYKVIAYPGNRVAVENLTAASFSETIEEPQAPTEFYYQVIACNDWRESEPAETRHLTYGKGITLPYDNSFNNESSLSLFHIIDGNGDGSTWRWSRFNNQTAYIFTGTDAEGDQDDWLMTPGLDMKGGSRYMLTYFTAGNAGTGYFHDYLEVGFGKGVDPQNFEIVESRYEYDIEDSHLRHDVIVEPAEDGYYRFGFHAVSNCKAGLAMNIDDIHIDVLANQDAPAGVTNLTYKTSKGAAPITFTFNAPSKTRNGDNLESIDKVELWRDHSELAATATNAKPGKKMQMVDNKGGKGMTNYTIVAYNESGVGERVEVEFYVGLDIPTVPENVTLTDAGNGNVKLSWEAPEIGARGGYVDPLNLTYNIFSVVNGFAVDYKFGYSGDDIIIPVGDKYYSNDQSLVMYGVSAANTTGESGIVGSTEVIVGRNYAYPFNESWAYGSAKNKMWYVSRSGMNCWEIKNDNPQDNDGGLMGFIPAEDGDMSYISLGKVDMSNAEKPALVFWYYAVPGTESFIDAEVNRGFTDGWDKVTMIDYKDLEGEAGWREVRIDLAQYKMYPYISVRFLGGGNAGEKIYIDNLRIADEDIVGVHDLTESSEARTRYYNLQGIRIPNPENGGILIEVDKNGKVNKMFRGFSR